MTKKTTEDGTMNDAGNDGGSGDQLAITAMNGVASLNDRSHEKDENDENDEKDAATSSIPSGNISNGDTAHDHPNDPCDPSNIPSERMIGASGASAIDAIDDNERGPSDNEHNEHNEHSMPTTPSEANQANAANTANSDSEPHDVPSSGENPSNPANPESSTNPVNPINSANPELEQQSMELNIALEALESMRRANLEVEFSTATSTISSLPAASAHPARPALPAKFAVHHDRCTYCQREALYRYVANPTVENAPREVQAMRAKNSQNNGGEGEAREGRGLGLGLGLGERMGVKLDGSRIRRFRNRLFSKSMPASSESEHTFATTATNDTATASTSEDSGMAESCPPKLSHPSSKSLSSLGSDDVISEQSEFESPPTCSTPQNGNDNTRSIPARTHKSNKSNKSSKLPKFRKTHHPCLTCGHPTCSSHSSPTFSSRRIPICQPCAYLFELDFIVDVISNATTTSTNDTNEQNGQTAQNAKFSQPSSLSSHQQKVNEMIDTYDRAKLLLTYLSLHAPQISSALQTRTARSNHIGAGSSATGMVSGLTGVVGCSALLFPPVAAVGVPLLIASLVFGGTATAAQTGDAAVNYWSDSNRLAEEMVALWGMVLSLLRIVEVLNYGLMRDHLDVEGYLEDGEGGDEKDVSGGDRGSRDALTKEIRDLLEKHGVNTKVGVGALKNAVVGGLAASASSASSAAAATEVVVAAEAASLSTSATSTLASGAASATSGASVAARNSRYFSRVGTTALSSARFVPVAGGVLSAACLVVEGNELKRTLAQIKEGNPCVKAEQIRNISEEVDRLPDSSLIAGECRRVFELVERRRVKRAALGGGNSGKQSNGSNGSGGNVSLEDVTHGDISDLIGAMESSAVDAVGSGL